MNRRSRYHSIGVCAIAVGVGLWALLGSEFLGCYSHGETTCGQENSPRAPIRGQVRVRSIAAAGDAGPDGGDGSPLDQDLPGAGALVFVELCGLYSDNTDKSKGHPNYRYVALADKDGNFEVSIPRGPVGLHAFLEGYTYGATAIDDSTSAGIQVVNAVSVTDLGSTLENFAVATPLVRAGEPLTFHVDVKAQPKDPVSEEVLLGEPKSGLARAFGPPSRGRAGKGFPDGRWTVTVPAPAAGTYTYYAQAASEGCKVSKRLSAIVTVQ